MTLLERKRRSVQRNQNALPPDPIPCFVAATCGSFKLDGIEVTEQEVVDALSPSPAQRKFRSRAAQRIRNHFAILHHIEASLRRGRSLKASAVIRWYTSISSGLSMTELGRERMARLEQMIGRINSPQLRLQPAIQEIAASHAELLADPLFPSFNGILSRLLLRYHLGKCSLPFLILEDGLSLTDPAFEQRLTIKLLHAIDASYDLLLK